VLACQKIGGIMRKDKTLVNFFMPIDLKEVAKNAAKKENRTLSSFINQAVTLHAAEVLGSKNKQKG
jgi:uncharacterized protein (DUF1778 family)